jgi:UDP:flavonoid glycosyltransferase YjiC (YdhE family)
MIPMAWACRAAGHDVRFAAQPRVMDTITRAGMCVSEVGGSCDFQAAAAAFFARHPELLGGDNGNKPPAGSGPRPDLSDFPWITSAAAIAEDLIAFGRWWRPDLIIADPMFYAGPLLAEVLGVPLVRHLFSPDWTRAGFGMGGFPERDPRPARWPQALVSLYEAYGARTALDFADLSIDPFPPSLQVPGLANRVTVRPMPYNGTAAIPGWLAAPPDRPRVCVTWGSSTVSLMGKRAFLVPQIVQGVADLDVEVILAITGSDRDMLGAIPPGMRVAENFPLDVLLPTCSGMVSQGGAGGMITAAVHGVPQVIIPMMGDQPVHARLLAATGAGVELEPAALSPADVRDAVAAIVSGDGPAAAARRLQAEIRALPAPAEVIGTLEEVVKRRAASVQARLPATRTRFQPPGTAPPRLAVPGSAR